MSSGRQKIHTTMLGEGTFSRLRPAVKWLKGVKRIRVAPGEESEKLDVRAAVEEHQRRIFSVSGGATTVAWHQPKMKRLADFVTTRPKSSFRQL